MSRSAQASRVVAILGMHRSGTSWLAGGLQQLGLELGEVSTSAPHNQKGSRENRELRQLHESVLRRNGGSWRSPRWPNRWSRKQRRQLAAYIEAMSDEYAVWGFKDPRSLLVLDEWHRRVPDLERVAIYRHPVAVFRSLHGRHPDFVPEEAIELWRIYNARLLAEHTDAQFPIIRFDVEPEVLRSDLATIGRALHLEHSDRADAFFDPGLVHNREAAAEAVPREVAEEWEALEAIRSGAVA